MLGDVANGAAPSHLGSRVLLLATGHLGNNLFCTPAIRFLRKHRPQSRFDVVAMSRRSTGAFEHNPDIGKIFRVRSKHQVRRIANDYDTVLGLHADSSRRYASGLTGQCLTIGLTSGDKHRADAILE